ncbi:MAG TPA: DUF4388 domain-containing protein [Thermoanaerobaculia bacterium]|nr:DUF4388 domain-containing protein [Thermoanaerobaculia bacterium]
MALEGTLKDFSLADIFQLIGLQRKTGVLTLKGKEDTVTVTFLDGRVVGADTLNRKLENRLGAVLVRTGYLNAEQLNKALEIQKETLQRLGFILTHHGILSVEQLREALQMQTLQVIYRLFRWKDGEYHFSQETMIEYDQETVVPITAESILMEGARMIDEWPIIEKRIRSGDMIFRKKAVNQEIVVVEDDEDADEVDFDASPGQKKKGGDQLRISPSEKLVYDKVDGKATVAEIIDTSRYSEFDTTKALYELAARDLIEEARAEKVSARAAAEAEEVVTTEVPKVLPLPLIILLGALAVLSLATSARNPLNFVSTRDETRPLGPVRKAISLQRIETLGGAAEAYNLANGRPTDSLTALAPAFLSPRFLRDPWGREYKYIQRADKYLIIGFDGEGKPDTDLFLTQAIGVPPVPESRPPSGGIELVD